MQLIERCGTRFEDESGDATRRVIERPEAMPALPPGRLERRLAARMATEHAALHPMGVPALPPIPKHH
jgi:hypothetical protein